MRHSCFGAALAAAGALVLLAPPPAPAQSSPATAKSAASQKAWTPPRTADGHPDFEGVYTNNTVTPLERPKRLEGKEFYTDAEMAENQKREKARLDKNEEDGLPTKPGTAADVHYDFSQFGLDKAQSKLNWSNRTSIIVGPEGRIPPLTPEARQRLADRAAKAKGHELDRAQSRPLGARCLAREDVGPPLMPTAYNSNLQIVQGPGFVVIEAEMIHDARIIPTDGRPHLSKDVRQWYGDSVGHWEGDTLVIDTTNFTDETPFVGAQNLHVIERLKPVSANAILYQFTVEDPGMWTKPWSGELTIARIPGQIYEYACHEANYGLINTLTGARVAERDAAEKAAK